MSESLEKLRIGQGYDIHRLAPDLPLFLGGIQIESSLGCIAHSDGDVLLHALIDALLGATGQGDIGDHFPPSDEQYKHMASSELLRRIQEKLRHWQLINLDSTVFLEAPKLGPYKRQIRENLSKLLSLPLENISLKAKTTEKTGAIGAREAIGASVTLLLKQAD